MNPSLALRASWGVQRDGCSEGLPVPQEPASLAERNQDGVPGSRSPKLHATRSMIGSAGRPLG